MPMTQSYSLSRLNPLIGETREQQQQQHSDIYREDTGPQKRQQLNSIDSSSNASEEERIRQYLTKKVQLDQVDDFYIHERLLTFELCDQFTQLLESIPSTPLASPYESSTLADASYSSNSSSSQEADHIQAALSVRLVEAYYVGQGQVSIHGRQCTLYHQCLTPFGIVNPADGTFTRLPGDDNMHDIAQNVRTIFERHFSGLLFCRAFGYALYRLDHYQQHPEQSAKDTLFDAYFVALYSIKLLEGKLDEFLNMEFGDIVEDELVYYKSSKVDMTADDLLWCFSVLLLKIGRHMRQQMGGGEAINGILESPFGTVMQEELQVAQLAVQIRPESPAGFLESYQAVMDVRNTVPAAFRDAWMTAAYEFVTHGLSASSSWGDPFYRYTFQMIMAYWLPTTTHAPETYSFEDVQKMVEEANKFKEACQQEVPASFLSLGEEHEASLQYLLTTVSNLNSKTAPLPPLADAFSYPSAFHQSSSVHAAQVPSRAERECGNCGKMLQKKLSCSRCGMVNYCNRTCQLAHWKSGHKAQCQKLKKSGTNPSIQSQ